MHQGGLLITVALLYLAALFGIAYLADLQRRARLSGQPLIYSLSLAVYCTSWTFYGTVGQASQDPWSPLPIYLGPMLVFLFGWRVLARLILVSKREHITSIADFIAARYGKSQQLAMLVTLVAIMGVLPYLVLQLKAIVTGLDLLTAGQLVAYGNGGRGALALAVGMLLALFSILFGTRHLDATEHHRGMVVAVALESVVKLLAFFCVGGFALWLLLTTPGVWQTDASQRFVQAATHISAGQGLELAIYTLLSMCAIICLPRQFHVTVVENHQGQDLHWARWIFPAYLFLMGIFIWPLALAGRHWLGDGVSPDSFVINLPHTLGFDAMALLAFMGGTSAAAGMVIVSTLALSIMVSNDLVLPLLLRRYWQQRQDERLARLLLRVRRATIVLILLAAWGLYLWMGELTSLSRIGYLSFGAVAQFAPALLLGLYWRRGNRKGVYLGLVPGLVLWLLTLLHESGMLAGSPLAELMSPPDLPVLRDIGTATWCLLLSLLLNLAGYVAGSLLTSPAVSERLQAANFVGKPSRDASALYQARVSVKELEMLATRFLGPSRVKRAFGRFAAERGGTLAPHMQASPELIVHTERLLAGVFGASSARLVLASALQGHHMQLEEIATIVDEASDLLRFNRGLLQGAIEHIGLGISVVDRELKLVAWNRRYVELFNYPSGLVQVGRPIEEIIRYNASQGLCGPGEIEAQVSKRVAYMQRGSRHVSARERPDGRVIEMQGNPMPGGGFVMTFTDITPFREAEKVLREANELLEARVAERTRELSALNQQLLTVNQQVERANQSKSRFLAAVSHDLTQPLNAAKLFASTLREQLPDGEPARLAERIDTALEAAEDLISDLLDISRLEAGKFKARMADMPLRDVFDTLQAEFGVLAKAGGMTFRVVPTQLWTHSDGKLLRRVLQNFLTNAFRYNPEGHVLLGCRRVAGRVRIEVWDNGPGIPHEKQSEIFEEFQRLDHSRTAREQGLGLGLAIARGISTVLGHTISMQSWPGRGSVFTVTLGRTQPSTITAEASQPLTIPPGSLSGLPVLCVDNEPEILQAMYSLLERWGCDVRCVADLGGALAVVEDGFVPRLVLSDYHLDDGRTGLQVLEQVRHYYGAEIAGIVISADRNGELLTRIRELGYGYISKPVKPPKLRALMTSLLDR